MSHDVRGIVRASRSIQIAYGREGLVVENAAPNGRGSRTRISRRTPARVSMRVKYYPTDGTS